MTLLGRKSKMKQKQNCFVKGGGRLPCWVGDIELVASPFTGGMKVASPFTGGMKRGRANRGMASGAKPSSGVYAKIHLQICMFKNWKQYVI